MGRSMQIHSPTVVMGRILMRHRPQIHSDQYRTKNRHWELPKSGHRRIFFGTLGLLASVCPRFFQAFPTGRRTSREFLGKLRRFSNPGRETGRDFSINRSLADAAPSQAGRNSTDGRHWLRPARWRANRRQMNSRRLAGFDAASRRATQAGPTSISKNFRGRGKQPEY